MHGTKESGLSAVDVCESECESCGKILSRVSGDREQGQRAKGGGRRGHARRLRSISITKGGVR
jgi:hypothetical protein